MGLLKEGEGIAAQVLRSLNVDVDSIRSEIMKALDPNYIPAETKAEAAQGQQGSVTGQPSLENLKTYGRDLTEMALEGKLDPVIGRSDETERIVQILCRRNKNNPVLIGEALASTNNTNNQGPACYRASRNSSYEQRQPVVNTQQTRHVVLLGFDGLKPDGLNCARIII